MRKYASFLTMSALVVLLAISMTGQAVAGRVQMEPRSTASSSWVHIGLSGARINDISAAPADASTLVAAVDGDVHLAKTTDGGTTWMDMANSPTNLLAVKYAPQSDSVLYAGTAIYTFRSANGGETWSAAQLKSGTDTSDFWIKPDNAEHILVATTDTLARPYGIHLNTQSGWGSWQRTLDQKTLTLAGDPNNPSHVYAGTHHNGAVVRSTNGGFLNSWTLVSPGGAWVSEVRDIEIDGETRIFAATNDGLWRKVGAQWTRLGGLPSADITDLAIDLSSNPGIVYAGTAAHGVFISNDSGDTWAAFNDGLGNLDITKLEISGSVLYAGTASNGVWKTGLGEPATSTPTPTEAPEDIINYLPLILKAWQRPTPIPTPTFSPTPTISPTPMITPTPLPTNTPPATPTREPGAWIIENVDCGNYADSMDDHSLRLDSAGRPHVAYGASHLFHAVRDNGVWQVEQVDGADRVGAYASLDLDGGGYPHISYRDNDQSALKYAWQDAGGWHTETVDNSADVGEYTSIAVDGGGYPHIIYHDVTHSDLKYAYQDAGGWHFETADSGVGYPGPHSSLVLDQNDRPHISYQKEIVWPAGGRNDSLIYATRDSQGWQRTILELEAVQYTSIALDVDGDPHISYYAWTSSSLKYVYHDAGDWHTETISEAYPNGWYSSIGVNGEAQISYQGSLEYARRQGDGWATAPVDEGGATGLFTSLALDASGHPHISYFDSDAVCIKYAHFGPGAPPTTVTPTATVSATATSTVTPTTTPQTLSGIVGNVTEKNQPANAVALSLMREENGTETAVATTTTDDNGDYLFSDAPSLATGQRYYVRFGRNTTHSSRVLYWFGPWIDAYTAGTSVSGGDFDIADVRPQSPPNNATRAFPVTFVWQRRGVTGDTFGLRLFDLATSDTWSTGDIGDVDSYVLTGLPSGAAFGTIYGWNPLVFNGNGSYGIPFYYGRITFTESAAKDQSSRQTFTPLFDQTLSLRKME